GVPLRPPVPPQRHDCPQRRRLVTARGDGAGDCPQRRRLVTARRCGAG
ncbi:hypothetical protein GTY49_14155, partial [Streptomyces sp. SID5477]|nr:hypothetical protein [Streptomyces sp. SID5477]